LKLERIALIQAIFYQQEKESCYQILFLYIVIRTSESSISIKLIIIVNSDFQSSLICKLLRANQHKENSTRISQGLPRITWPSSAWIDPQFSCPASKLASYNSSSSSRTHDVKYVQPI